jgi:DNA-binding protein HU-beta
MNKTDLIDAIAQTADVTKAIAGKVLDATLENIIKAIAKGESVPLIGFGTFVQRERAARTGRNPRTGEAIQIKGGKIPGFKPGKMFKDAVKKHENKEK